VKQQPIDVKDTQDVKNTVINNPGEEDDRAPGTTTIAPDVLVAIARLATLEVPGVSRMGTVPGGPNRLFTRTVSEGVRIDIREDSVTAELYIILKNDVNIRDVSRKVQQDVARAISEMVGMRVGRVNVHIEDIDYPVEPDKNAPDEA
jgi:uncharacterized alkaline shock family protein YloU